MIILPFIEEGWRLYSIFKAVSKRGRASADLGNGSRVFIGHTSVFQSFADMAGPFD